MKHLDLFSGIGGFALAAEMVWENIEHTFVEYDPFCQEILRKHWPQAAIHGDIREFIADSQKRAPGHAEQPRVRAFPGTSCDILTGGFPCQPFSHAGRRKGTADDRYLWPQMLECIALYNPRWVIAENVAGLTSWNDGLVLETVCADLEKEGYEVCPFVLPACAVGAPHRRDRVWIIGRNTIGIDGWRTEKRKMERDIFSQSRREESANSINGSSLNVADADGRRAKQGHKVSRSSFSKCRSNTWAEPWPKVATALCRMDDGLPRRLDRASRLKALGNAIVPQVAAEIMRGIAHAMMKSP